MKKIVVAGANSFVASHFVYELLVQNYHVVALVRGNRSKFAAARMDEALIDTKLNLNDLEGELTVVDYALLEDDFSIPEKELDELYSGDIDYFHFAASLKFDYRSKEEIFKTNINGVENALRIFDQYSSDKARFFFISTAYSCGLFSGVFEEKFYPDHEIDEFRNYYEQSKRLAENVLRSYMDSHGLVAHVIRLSQVVGDSRTGVTRTEYGIFDFAKRIQALTQKHPNQTVRIKADPDATQNLIPIDTVINDLISVVKEKDVPVIMNFVARDPVQNRKIIRSISDLLPIELVPVKNIDKADMNELEKRVLAGMAFTGNYIDTDIDFDTSERDKVISPFHREVNESSVFAMLAFYLDQIWAKEELVKSEL